LVLRGAIHRAVERRDIDLGIAKAFGEQRRGPRDLALAGQEDEERAALGRKR
jgi:hypothetical protein